MGRRNRSNGGVDSTEEIEESQGPGKNGFLNPKIMFPNLDCLEGRNSFAFTNVSAW